MSLSNTTENATLKMHLQGTDPSYRAGATQYLALFTADPGEAASLAAELDDVTGQAEGTVAVGGQAATLLGNVVGAAVGTAIAAGASAQPLDAVTGAAAGAVTNVVTLRQRQGRRDDRDLLVSGWR